MAGSAYYHFARNSRLQPVGEDMSTCRKPHVNAYIASVWQICKRALYRRRAFRMAIANFGVPGIGFNGATRASSDDTLKLGVRRRVRAQHSLLQHDLTISLYSSVKNAKYITTSTNLT